VITFYVLSQPNIRLKLAEELQDADLSSLSWAALEKLPYLSAVINEGLRLSYGVSARTPRVATEEHLVYRGEIEGRGKVQYVIPKGTAIGSKLVPLSALHQAQSLRFSSAEKSTDAALQCLPRSYTTTKKYSPILTTSYPSAG
jgi:hypothetical protein